MGCDIHTFVERRDDTGAWQVLDGEHPFNWRSYGMFGFLADVRNYSAVPPIREPRGLPNGVSQEVRGVYEGWDDYHTPTWLTVRELAEFDYTRTMNDRRVIRQTSPNGRDGGVTGTPEEGQLEPFSEFLGTEFLAEIEHLKMLGSTDKVRVVLWFDN